MSFPTGGDRAISTLQLVKSEDLNHHHTLYGGRCVEWCVHAAYIAAESCFDRPQPLVFMSIRSLSMRAPARLGDIIQLVGEIDYVGDSTIGVRVDARITQPTDDQKIVATGTFLFCSVDEAGRAIDHGLKPRENEKRSSRERWQRTISEERAHSPTL
ncbi:MAG TPA: acyl-CoA thioesterase [Phycisphaerae bacterium]|nr:acyl-CoA thioesterase [Phycisphaerae bacterium]